MLDCHSCLIRCLRAIASDSFPAGYPAAAGARLRQRSRITHASIQSRGYTNETSRPRERYPSLEHRERNDEPGSRRRAALPESRNGRDEAPRSRRGDGDGDGEGEGEGEGAHDHKAAAQEKPHSLDVKRYVLNKRRRLDVSKDDASETDFAASMSPQLERAVRKELMYLKDPLKHANHVRQTLRANDFDKALALCRIASKEMQVIVSWNHTIDWLLVRRELRLALKIYNEMKKRAQFPDSHTYVILLRGLAVTPVHSETVGKAVSIYHSLAAPNSKVVQSIIHTNAALKVCARGNDMDSMWGIASKIPDKGPGAADNFTFTTILNAIQFNAVLESGPQQDKDAMLQIRQTAVSEGRRVWEEIIGKWRRGDLAVDEELVCAMGRILLISPRARDWDDVLSLLEQSMDIPRLAAKLGTPERKAEHLRLPRVLEADAEPNEEEEEVYGEFDKDLLKVPRRAGGSGGSIAYVRPSNNTLSIVMEACLKMASPKIANQYWDLLTARDSYAIIPDIANLNMYLRLLRHSRSSSRVVEVLRDDILAKNIHPQRATYRIAMSACNRDKNNSQAVKNASAILDMMENDLSELDIKAVQMFLDQSIATEDGKTIVHSINRLGPVVQNLKSQISLGSDKGAAASDSLKVEALLLFRTIIGAIDQLLNKGLVSSDEHDSWTQRRSRLAAYVTRINIRMEGKTGFDEDRKREMRRESRTLRNFRRNDVRRTKKEDGTYVPRKKITPLGDRSEDVSNSPNSARLGDLPGDLDSAAA